jgi:hypothetical protein
LCARVDAALFDTTLNPVTLFWTKSIGVYVLFLCTSVFTFYYTEPKIIYWTVIIAGSLIEIVSGLKECPGSSMLFRSCYNCSYMILSIIENRTVSIMVCYILIFSSFNIIWNIFI